MTEIYYLQCSRAINLFRYKNLQSSVLIAFRICYQKILNLLLQFLIIFFTEVRSD